MNPLFRPIFIVLLPVALAACSPGYVLRATWEEAKILQPRTPISRVIADPRTDEATRTKLALVLEARAYAAGFEAGALRCREAPSRGRHPRGVVNSVSLRGEG